MKILFSIDKYPENTGIIDDNINANHMQNCRFDDDTFSCLRGKKEGDFYLISFDLQDKIFDLFVTDTELLSILQNPSTPEELNLRCRREDVMPELLSSQSLPFLAFYFLYASPTGNPLLNKGIMQFDFYSDSRAGAILMVKAVRRILQHNFANVALICEGQVTSETADIYKYRFRISTNIDA